MDESRLPRHLDLLIHHQPHAVLQAGDGRGFDDISAPEAIAAIDPRSWVSPEQLSKAIDINSFWIARWMLPDCSGVVFRAAADINVLIEAISEPASP